MITPNFSVISFFKKNRFYRIAFLPLFFKLVYMKAGQATNLGSDILKTSLDLFEHREFGRWKNQNWKEAESSFCSTCP